MNTVTIIRKPAPHCLIPASHGAASYVPSEDTDIRRTWARAQQQHLADDYDINEALSYLESIGGFKP